MTTKVTHISAQQFQQQYEQANEKLHIIDPVSYTHLTLPTSDLV